MKYKVGAMLLVLALALIFTSGCIVVTTAGPGYGVPTYGTQIITVPPKTTLSITRNQLSQDASGNKIGLVSITNIGAATQDIASVTGKFLNSSGVIVSSSTDTILNLVPGETWDYTFTCSGANCNTVTTFTVDVTYN
jgi:hypothetical protein